MSTDTGSDMAVVVGKVNGKPATVLRDSGADTVIVGKRLLGKRNFTGRMGNAVFVGGFRGVHQRLK